MIKLKNILTKILEVICVIMFAFITIVGTYQIVTRYVFNAPSTVSEELLTYSFTWLALLAANAVFSPRFNARRQMMRTELAAQERAASGSASADARQRKLLAEFSEVSGVSRALFCDHIARAVPDRVVLTALDVEPLVKRFEAGKPLQRLENRVVVCGTAPAAADVSAFVQRLSQTGYGRDVRLVNLEKERDGDRLTFRIETAL